MKDDGLFDGQAADAGDRGVDSCVIFVGANTGLHHFGGKAAAVRIEVHHGAAKVAPADADGRVRRRMAFSPRA